MGPMRLPFVFLSLLLISACGDVSSPSGDPDAGPDGPDTGPKTITFTSELSDGTPANIELAAYKDGDAAWQLITGTAGVYTFQVTGQRYAIATACERVAGLTNVTEVNVRYATIADGLTRFDTDGCTVPAKPDLVSISGSVAAAPAGQAVRVSSGNGSATAANNAWMLSVLPGAGTLMALSMTATTPSRPTSMLLRKASFAANSTFALDFSSGFFPAESSLTLDPTAVNRQVTTSYRDEEGGNHLIESNDGAPTYRVVPGDRVGNGLSLLSLVSTDAGASRSIARAFKSPVAQTLTLPAAFVPTSAPVAVSSTPYPIFEAVLPRRSGVDFYRVFYTARVSRTLVHSWDLTATAAWVEGQAGNDITVRLPDLSSLAGWKPAYALTDTPSWTVTAASAPKAMVPGAASILRKLGDGEEASTSSYSGFVPAQ